MALIIDGYRTPIELGRDGSIWFTHPKRQTACMRIERYVITGYHSNLGIRSTCNKLQLRFVEELKLPEMKINVEALDVGRYLNSSVFEVKLIFTFEETDKSWGEQRLQEQLDTVLAIERKLK